MLGQESNFIIPQKAREPGSRPKITKARTKPQFSASEAHVSEATEAHVSEAHVSEASEAHVSEASTSETLEFRDRGFKIIWMLYNVTLST